MKQAIRSIASLLLILAIGSPFLSIPVHATAAPATTFAAVVPAWAVKPASAQSAPAQTKNARYTDPQGLFSVPIPTNWQIAVLDEYLLLASPQEQINLYFLTFPGADINAAIADAWAIVEPTFAMPLEQVIEIPPMQVEQIRSLIYDSGGESGHVVAAVGQLYRGMIYVQLVRAELVALQQRTAQLQVIQTGFTIYALHEVNLAGVRPRLVDTEIIAQWERYIADVMARFHIPGAAVAVVQGNEIVYSQGFGVRALGRPEPVTPTTRMMIGSLTKTMTTMMMATLVDEGRLAWDTPVVQVLPTFALADPALTRRITMRNLVCACTGVPQRDFELFFNGDHLSAERVITSLKNYKLFTDFGETFQYSNQMVAVAGYATAAAATDEGGDEGNLYDRYLKEMTARVFQPIGMTSTTFALADVQKSNNYASPHGANLDMVYERLPLRAERLITPVAPAGAAWSNVMDLGRYLITELQGGVAPDGQRVVSRQNLSATWTPQVAVSAKASYGLGWFVDEYKGQRLLHHGGNTLGFTADLAFLPTAELGIVVLSNAQGANHFTQAVRFRLLELLFAQPQQFDAQATFLYEMVRKTLTDQGGHPGVVEPNQIQPYLGRYTNTALGDINIRLEDSKLFLDAGEATVELRAWVDEQGQVEKYLIQTPPLVGIPVKFKADGSGSPRLILGNGVTRYTFTPVLQLAMLQGPQVMQ
ncbi:MAG: class A beta-lactamase-related serine hydrolase [Caldilinea sp. CFX5]|nr:class A beta-lactamase-related serine hydrolase [Caldilinea sp. CFX5]